MDNSKGPIVPISFGDKDKKIVYKGVSFFDQDINNKNQFAILKTTENGKYVRGNKLFYEMNGVQVYTELNNIIFVDSINHTLFIEEYEHAINEIAPDNPEQKQYIVLYTDLGYEDGSEPLRWEAYIGRTNTFQSIKTNLPVIDLDKSLVLVDNVALKDALSVRKFIEFLKNADYIDEEINLEDYSYDENYV
jgi:hypothetical protein